MKYRLDLTGTIGWNPADRELVFDHLKVEVEDGLELEELVGALFGAVMKAQTHRPTAVDSIEAAYPYEADEKVMTQVAALAEADRLFTNEPAGTDVTGQVMKVLAPAGIRVDLDPLEVRLLHRYLVEQGVLPAWATAKADVEGVPKPTWPKPQDGRVEK